MQIETIHVNNYKKIKTPVYANYKCSFGNKISIPATKINQGLELLSDKIGLQFRILANRIRNNKAKRLEYERFWNTFSKVDRETSSYIKYLYNFSKKIGKNKEVEINLESQRLLDIVHSDESCIFIMNHENQKHDPKMLGILNTLLYGAYIKAGKSLTCPRPKILFNEAILQSMDINQRKIMEKFGAVGINASLFNKQTNKNAGLMLSLLKDFANNKSHIFIFPEGKMVYFNNADLRYKFQTGIAEIVNAATKFKKDVKVMPVGFYYNKNSKDFLGSIFLGEPIAFMQKDKKIFATKGNIDSEFSTKSYKDFFSEIDSTAIFKEITEKGQSIKLKDIADYIAGILCENLRICMKEAEKQVPMKSLGDNVKLL